jgi:hypothetical protein
MDREWVLLAGTLAGFIAAMLSITEKLLDFRDRLRTGDDRENGKDAPPAPVQEPDRPPRLTQPAWKLVNVSSYLLLHELAVIVTAGVMLNYAGLMLSLRLQSILYLDMIGTALAALLLGPWWGALVALLSSCLVNWVLYPGTGADVVIFPWVLVNMAGGLFWGVMGRRTAFRKYLKTPRASALAHGGYLVTFGVVGAAVMALPGTLVQGALSEPSVFALNADVARALEGMIEEWQATVDAQLEGILGMWSGGVGWALLSYIQNFLRYTPDKTLTVALALMILKYAFPLFERELVHGGPGKARIRDTAAAPLMLGALYLLVFFGLMTTEAYRGEVYWPVWSIPWAVILIGLIVLRRWGPSDETARHACLARAARYAQALKPIQREPAHDFAQRLGVATLAASLVFVLCLPLIVTNFYQAAFNFFCVVYGFLLGVYLIRIVVSQNVSVSRR